MEFIADILLVAGAIGAAIYCSVLGHRLNRFNDLEKGVGGAVAVLSAQVDDLNRTLAAAQQTAAGSARTLTDLAKRAENISHRLELQMASMHDIPPEPEEQVQKPQAAPPAPDRSAAPMFARRASPANAGGAI